MKYHGRVIDPVALWSNYVEFPSNFRADDGEFLPLVTCPNPEHHTDKRHFQINVKKPLVHCFANCGISGTYEHAISLIEGGTRREARKVVLRHSRVGGNSSASRTPRAKGKSDKGTSGAIELPDPSGFSYLPPVATEYLENRRVSAASVAKWGIGWDATEKRVMIPIRDDQGRLRAYAARAWSPKQYPKYLYTEGFDRNSLLFGACYLDPKQVQSSGIVLVEGSLDTIIQHQNEISNTVGILGSYLSEIQARLIHSYRPSRVYLLFDRDAAGVGAVASCYFRLRKIPLFVCRYPSGKDDPAQLTQKEALRIISRAIPIQKFKQQVPEIFKSKEKSG